MPTLSLEPALVWRHFAALAAIPRPSKHEARVRGYIERWARQHGLEAETDAAGNLLIRQPATPGGAALPGYVLQAHLDMVCQALPQQGGADFDFLLAGITPRLETRRDGAWLAAEGTTLGADNGIGVALALAALEDGTLAHGPLEVLLTVDEEAGMGGASGLAAGWLQSRRMLNLDTEVFGEFYVGCAGGCDVEVECAVARAPLPMGWVRRRLKVGGLVGGHSGCDIHKGRGNANQILVAAIARLDAALAKHGGVRLIAFAGGTARNAIPRDAWAELALMDTAVGDAERALADLAEGLRVELTGIDDGLALTLGTPDAGHQLADILDPLTHAEQARLLTALRRAPCGVAAMSQAVAGVVETSNNLGVMELSEAGFSANLMVRSLHDTGTTELAEKIAAGFRAAGCTVLERGRYPGWAPNPASPLLAHARRVFEQTFGHPATMQVIHAGLECGLIGERYPDLDILSFGPTIEGAHAPGERVHVGSVGKTWRLLRAIITTPA